MRVRWLGVGFFAILVVCTLLLKSHTRHNTPSPAQNSPAVILVADLREADDPDDPCANIIHAVREVSKRGIPVAELSPNSKSDLLRRYRVLTVPTVLLLDTAGNEIGRFEGEDAATVRAVQTRLSVLARSKP